MDLSPLDRTARQLADNTGGAEPSRPRAAVAPHRSAVGPTAAERILAAEMAGRAESNDALSMMVASIARMVQAGKTRDSRWKAS
ncbi:MAG: hypothetical protein VKO65_00580 [Cyanobacteriota bacterium]|nr:hypothetical protein [Cyanobacteriota bacterium]